MPLLETVETIGALWLTMSAVGFILFAIFSKPVQRSVTAAGQADSAESISPVRDAATVHHVEKLRTMLDGSSDKSERDRKRDTRKIPAKVA